MILYEKHGLLVIKSEKIKSVLYLLAFMSIFASVHKIICCFRGLYDNTFIYMRAVDNEKKTLNNIPKMRMSAK